MLPAPDLDDRHFQDLVDDAKRLVQQRCPSWTDHNVSDPGVTLIEAVAQMVDQLIYRLNRVPDLHYVKFLELIGVELRSSAASRGETTFWLSAPQPQNVTVRGQSQVATARTDISDPVVFSTTRELTIVSCAFAHSATQPFQTPPVDTTMTLGRGGFRAFNAAPVAGDALLIGLSEAVGSCAVLLRLDCTVSGRGVDPRRPPVIWEAWTGGGWSACDLGSDDTGGLNKPGDVIIHVPVDHQTSVIAKERAGWIRCRLVQAQPDQPTYTESPTVIGIEAFTIGGTAPTINAETVREEVLGRSDGTPGQRFALRRRPVVAADIPLTCTVLAGEDRETWTEVAHFAQSGPSDRHFRVDAYAGEVHFGPAIRAAGGELISYGAVPPAGAIIRLDSYRTGGGQAGNVARGQVRVMKTSIPYVSRVENRAPAIGGAEPETLTDAKARGPLLLRSRGRAVTAEDFEELARDVAPDAARVACVPEPGATAGVRVLVVPHVASDEAGRIERADLDPPWQILERISNALDERRLVGTRLLVQPPDYRWLTAVVSLSCRSRFDPQEVRTEVQRALYQLYHPLVGGPDGAGWPFGRSVQSHEVHAALARIPGVDMSREVRVALYPAEADSGRRDAAVERIDLPPTALVYSFDHQVRVTR
ncbi:MAG: putative baseplate assembly protein [Microlunatus sp.]|nr:putative baseplate assembly protein [Microlunatus sp.]MDN5771621.1 putative baseplate assembly protein [Microlunatus sp.]